MSQALVERYHRALPKAIRHYLVFKRGLSADVIERFKLGWNGERITIPIFDRDGRFSFFKLAKAPWGGSDAPKMLAWPSGVQVELYGWEQVLERPSSLVICEVELP